MSNKQDAQRFKSNYEAWKKESLTKSGYFPIFQSFRDSLLLRDISPNALKLYIFLGLSSKNMTGESFVGIDSLAKYFEKTPRSISNWIKELENAGLIKRVQMQHNSVAYTYLMPYGLESLHGRR